MSERPKLIIVETGVANLASVRALAGRLGLEPEVSADPEVVARAPIVILPGVGAFGPAMEKLANAGLDRAMRARVGAGLPTAGICLGMQLFFEESEESEGVRGLGILKGKVTRLAGRLPLPQLGWNRIEPEASARLLEPGWVYFANSYGVDAVNFRAPDGSAAADAADVTDTAGVPGLSNLASTRPGGAQFSTASASTIYGAPFISAIEGWRDGKPNLLLCQFHPELSGPFGTALFARWLELNRLRSLQ